MMSGFQAVYYSLRNIMKAHSGLNDYAQLLQQARAAGYTFYTLAQFVDLIRSKSGFSEPYLILRHDIDTDCDTALAFAGIEHEMGIKASYFFRLSTWKTSLIKRIAALDHEVGYHYEELATFAKTRHLTNQSEVRSELPRIRKAFAQNLLRLRRESGLPLRGFASHGDFANRKLDLTNRLILTEQSFRDELSLDYEAYDAEISQAYRLHVSDKPYPVVFSPESPQGLITRGNSFLLLTHPRWWKTNLRANLQESLKRIWEQIRW